MRDFVFESRQKTTLLVIMGVGVACLAATYMTDDSLHMRFWGNYLHNTVFFTGMAAVAMFFMSAQIVAFSGWNALVRRIWEAEALFLIVGLVLFLPLIFGLFGHFHHLYHWNMEGVTDPNNANYDQIIAGKSPFLNKYFYTIATFVIVGGWYLIARKVRANSIEQDEIGTLEFKQYKRNRTLTAIFLPFFGYASVCGTWLWMMSIDAHWYSTMYGWYSWASLFLAMLSFTILLIVWLKRQGYLEEVTQEHLHDLGKYLFGITVFWTYLWYDQYMLIWYANIGEETIYFKERWFQYPLLHGGNLVVNFLMPFLILMRNDTKRKYGTLVFVGCLVFLGHWWDYFQMVKPGTRISLIEHQMHENGHAPKAELPASTHAEPAQTTTETAHQTAEPAHQTAGQGQDDAAHSQDAAHQTAEHGQAAATEHPTEKPATEEAHPATTAEAHPAAAGHGDHEAAAVTPHGPKPFEIGWSMPGFLEIGTMLGFLALFLYVVLNNLSKATLKPKNDPYMMESEHHQVI